MAEAQEIKLRIWPEYVVEANGQRQMLSPQKGMVLSMMMAGQINGRHRHTVAELLWPDPDSMPDRWSEHIQTVCSQVRKVLRRMGVDNNALVTMGRKQ